MIEAAIFFAGSIGVFLFWLEVHRRIPFILFNPLMLSIISIVSALVFLDIEYERYMRGGNWLSALIEPGVVALGYPLYKQIYLIRRQWKVLLGICIVASVSALTLNAVLARLLGLEDWVVLSFATANITTAIAMETSEQMGGSAALAAVAVLMAGFTGSAFGVLWLKVFKISRLPALGLAMGCASHALGTATIARTSLQASAFASTALILCAIFTAIVAPIYIPFLLSL